MARRESGRKFPTWDQIGENKGKTKKRKKREKKEEEKEKKKRQSCVRGKWSEKLYLLSKIYGDQTVGFCRRKRQSSSTRRELRVGIIIGGFRQTPRGRGSFLLELFSA